MKVKSSSIKTEFVQWHDWSSQDSETDSGFDTSDESPTEPLTNSKTKQYKEQNMPIIDMPMSAKMVLNMQNNWAAKQQNFRNFRNDHHSLAEATNFPSQQHARFFEHHEPEIMQMMTTPDYQDDEVDEEVSRIFNDFNSTHSTEQDILYPDSDSRDFEVCDRPSSPLNFAVNNPDREFVADCSCIMDSLSPVEFDFKLPEHVVRPHAVR